MEETLERPEEVIPSSVLPERAVQLAADEPASTSITPGIVEVVPAPQEASNATKGKQREVPTRIPVSTFEVTDLKGLQNVSNKHRAFLLKAGFTTTSEVLYTPLRPLSERLRLSEHECRELVQAIVDERKKRWITEGRSRSVAQQLRELAIDVDGDGSFIREIPSLTVGDHGIRSLLGGGLLPGTLTEVTGEASSGKTAFALQSSLHVQLGVAQGGLAGSCAYLSSEGNFPSTRLRDMAFKLSNGTPEGIKSFMDNVHLVHCPEVDELLHVVRYSLPAMVEQSQLSSETLRDTKTTFIKPVKLVVVDSIAAPFRGSEGGGKAALTEDDINKFANTSLTERNAALQEIAFRLRKLARQYSLVVLLVNQVSDVFHKDNDRFSSSQAHPSSQLGGPHGLGGSVTHENGGVPLEYRNYKHASKYFSGEEADKRNGKVAVFGLTWSNCIDTRIMLSRTGRRRRKETGEEAFASHMLDENGLEIEDPLFALETEEIRRASLIFGPAAEKGYIDCALRQEGLVSISKYLPTPRGPPRLKRRGKKRETVKNVVEKGGNRIMPIPANARDDEDSEDPEDEPEESDEEEALWADMPLDDATLSQL